MQTLVLIDFDGTLTWRDADFLIADALLPPERAGAYLPLAEAYERLELSTRDYYEGYLRLLGCDVDEISRQARQVPLRPGAAELVDHCRRQGWQLRVASEGLDLYVRPALEAAGLAHVELACNRHAPTAEQPWRILGAPDTEPCERCLSCKGSHVRRAQASGCRVFVVGDGASDLCGARLADGVVARGSLQQHCLREGIAHRSWSSLPEVLAALDELAR